MSNVLIWQAIWQELRDNIAEQPLCPEHHDYVHVRTLSRAVINDIIKLQENGILIRSHESRRNKKRFIKYSQFKKWWDYLVSNRFASLVPGHQNNPDASHSRIVGAIMATCLPNRIRVVDPNTPNTIELIE